MYFQSSCTKPLSAISSESDPGVVISIPAWSCTFMEINHEIFSTVYSHSPPSANKRLVGVSYKRKFVHEVLVNGLVKIAQEKSSVRLTEHHDMTIAVDWYVKPNKQTIQLSVHLASVCPLLHTISDFINYFSY